MKKTLTTLTMAIAIALASGCASNSAKTSAELEKQGQALAGNYQQTLVAPIEKVRVPINETFDLALQEYGDYVDRLKISTGIENVDAMLVNIKDEEKKKSAYESLDPKIKKRYDDFQKENSDMYIALGKTAANILLQQKALEGIDKKSLMSNLGFSEIISTKDALGYTYDQVSFLNDTVVAIVENQQTIATFTAAE